MTDIAADGSPAEIAPLRVGVVFRRATKIYGKGFMRLIGVTARIMAPSLILYMWPGIDTGPDNEDSWPRIAVIAVDDLLQFVASAVCAYQAFRIVRGESWTIGQACRIVLPRVLTIIGVNIAYLLLGGFGVLLFVAPGLIAFSTYYLAGVVCVVENLGVVASFKRSHTLTTGNRWRMLALFGGTWALQHGVDEMFSQIFERLDVMSDGVTILQFALDVLIQSFVSVLPLVAYHELRVGREGVDVDKLARVFD